MNLMQGLQLVALLCAAVFAGAAIYINLVEHPARMLCGAAGALQQFGPSYRRAARLQAPLAVLGFITGAGAWLAGSHWVWLLGGTLLGAVVPYTFAVLMGINRQLLGTPPEQANDHTLALLNQWNQRHMVRSLAGGLALVIFAGSLVAG